MKPLRDNDDEQPTDGINGQRRPRWDAGHWLIEFLSSCVPKKRGMTVKPLKGD